DPAARADLAEHDRACGGAYTNAESIDPPAPPHVAAVFLHLAEDSQRRAHRALCVVLTRRRRAEQRQHTVARQVLDMTAEPFDLADDARDGLTDDELHVLGVEPLAERRRADHVDEEGGDDLALLAYGARHRVGKARHAPAARALRHPACAASARSTASSPA